MCRPRGQAILRPQASRRENPSQCDALLEADVGRRSFSTAFVLLRRCFQKTLLGELPHELPKTVLPLTSSTSSDLPEPIVATEFF